MGLLPWALAGTAGHGEPIEEAAGQRLIAGRSRRIFRREWMPGDLLAKATLQRAWSGDRSAAGPLEQAAEVRGTTPTKPIRRFKR